jgi:hypothetical protein
MGNDTTELVVDACMRPAHRVTSSVRNLTFEHGAPAFVERVVQVPESLARQRPQRSLRAYINSCVYAARVLRTDVRRTLSGWKVTPKLMLMLMLPDHYLIACA